MRTALVAVVNGEAYERYAEQLMESAEQFFQPTPKVTFHILAGRAGWPDATMYRYHTLMEELPDAEFIYLCDADMRFEGIVGPEVLPDYEHWGSKVTVVQHPGYLSTPDAELPFERRRVSCAFWPRNLLAGPYYAGGFVGGERDYMIGLASTIALGVDTDARNGITAVWHDESHLNSALRGLQTPSRVLTPAYCYPDNDAYYRTIWDHEYLRLLVALDKTAEEREGR